MINTQQDQSNLLDSYSDPNNCYQIGHQSDSSQSQHHTSDLNEQQFLQHIDNILNNNTESHIMSKQEVLLQAQVIQLQMKCSALSVTNQKYVDQFKLCSICNSANLGAAQNTNSNNIQIQQQSGYVGDTTDLQIQFSQIQTIIASYRQQLQKYQQMITQQNKTYASCVQSHKNKIKIKDDKLFKLQHDLKIMNNNNQLIARKNQQLILQIQQLNQSRYRVLNQSLNKLDISYDKQYMHEMENLISKLAEQLQYERNMKKKLNIQIQRLNKQMTYQQKIIQQKNQAIYNLQLKLLRPINSHSKTDYSLIQNAISQKNVNARTKQRKTANINKHNERKTFNINHKNKDKYLLQQFYSDQIFNPQLAFTIVLKILYIYNDTEKKHTPRIIMNNHNLEIGIIQQANSLGVEVSLIKSHNLLQVAKTVEQYFWSTFAIIENLIISLPLDEMKNIKKAMQQLSYQSKNKRKLSSFDNLAKQIRKIVQIDQ